MDEAAHETGAFPAVRVTLSVRVRLGWDGNADKAIPALDRYKRVGKAVAVSVTIASLAESAKLGAGNIVTDRNKAAIVLFILLFMVYPVGCHQLLLNGVEKFSVKSVEIYH
ncbi:hypothetical protein CEK71_20205 [Methylovulum psychrotolerans]|uniref:Uncharacterized protein n=1 Tax=Methylovulum psychrotolerans TaxID=1704499 RepID=A0A1Z4C3V7_9GAMM|nr:hypothetical protein CEK71_20205 [Methylovulum psychrotolerans]